MILEISIFLEIIVLLFFFLALYDQDNSVIFSFITIILASVVMIGSFSLQKIISWSITNSSNITQATQVVTYTGYHTYWPWINLIFIAIMTLKILTTTFGEY